MHEDHLGGVALQERSYRIEHILKVGVQINQPIVNEETVIFMPATDIQGPHAYHHLISQGIGLGHEGVTPGTLPHTRM